MVVVVRIVVHSSVYLVAVLALLFGEATLVASAPLAMLAHCRCAHLLKRSSSFSVIPHATALRFSISLEAPSSPISTSLADFPPPQPRLSIVVTAVMMIVILATMKLLLCCAKIPENLSARWNLSPILPAPCLYSPSHSHSTERVTANHAALHDLQAD